MDTPSFLLLLGGCFLLAGTIVTTIAIGHAPMGIETDEGFFELNGSSDEHPSLPTATLRFH